MSVIIVFFGCVYNEFFILKCFNLDYETHFIISSRSESEQEMIDWRNINNEENEDNDEDKEIIYI